MSHLPLEKLVNDVKVLIVDLKKEYFQVKEALTDDEPLVHKLCIRLENVLRNGAREKYSFMGMRKDYWNFISESVPKDESVKHVQSIPDFKTNPGKGRAFLREALIQKSLADTLQRAIINTRTVKDYYGNESLVRSAVHFQSLIHSLYDLNAVEFELPHQGYDLDKGFPSFARKTFNSQLSSASRRSSISSIQSFQPDPLQNLRTNVHLIELVVNAWLGKVVENTENGDNEVSLLQLIDKLALLREHIILLKTKGNNEVETLKTDIDRLKEERLKSEAHMEQRLNLVQDHYKSKLDIDNSASGEKLKNISQKLSNTEKALSEMKEKFDSDISNMKNLLSTSQEEYETMRTENKELLDSLEHYQTDLATAKESNYSYSSTNKILEEKLSELQKINVSLRLNEKDVAEKNLQVEQMLKIKESELNVLQDAFQKSTGHVAGSVEELKSQLSSQQTKTSEVLSTVCSTNEGLLNESKVLLNENKELSFKLQVLEEKLLQETSKKEETQRTVSDLKSKYTEEMKNMCELQTFVTDIWDLLNGDTDELDDVEGDGLMMKSSKYNKDVIIQKIVNLQNDVQQWKKAKCEADAEIDSVQSELSSIKEALDTAQKSLHDVSDSENKSKELEETNTKLKEDIELFNGKIYDMSVDIITLNETLAKKQGDIERDMNIISMLKNELELIKNEKIDFEKELEDTVEQKESALNDLSVITQRFDELKGRQSIEIGSWCSEKENLTTQCEQLNKENKTMRSKYEIAEKENTDLKDELSKFQEELAKLVQEKDEEKSLHVKAAFEVDTLMEDSRIKEEEFNTTVNQHKQDLEDIKTLLVTSTQEKHELWEKKEHLEQEVTELREQMGERWVIDTEVTKCTSCEGQFTLTRRKHHCRLCGQIFCNDCSNRWIKSNQRRKRVRACNTCADAHEEKSDLGSPLDTSDMMSSSADRSSFFSCDEDNHDSERRVSEAATTDTNNQSSSEVITEEETTIHNPSHPSFEETATGDFEILAADDVSNAGSFGANQEVKLLSSDQMKSCLIPVCHTDDDLPAQMETIDVEVSAGYRVVLPVIVPSIKMNLCWEFTSTPKDIAFGVAFKPDEEGADEILETIVPISRYISHKLTIHGKMSIGNPGTYYLVFDNSYSRLTMKSVKCKVGLSRSSMDSQTNEE